MGVFRLSICTSKMFCLGDFLQNVLWITHKMKITWPPASTKRQSNSSEGFFSIGMPCDSPSLPLIRALALEITPNAPAFNMDQIRNGDGCVLEISSQDPVYTAAAVVGVVGGTTSTNNPAETETNHQTNDIFFRCFSSSYPHHYYCGNLLLVLARYPKTPARRCFLALQV